MTKAEPFDHVFVAGAGAWGTALALQLVRAGRRVTLWTRNEGVRAAIAATGTNSVYLPDIQVPDAIEVTTDPGAASKAEALVCVVPTQHIRTFLPAFRRGAGEQALPVALCCKGIEHGTNLFVHDVLAEVWPEAGASILSGPSFAADVSRGLPTAVTLADADPARGARWLASFGSPEFRPYLSGDLLGVALGGAAKNVLAIGCGVVEGAGLGESAKAALMARGFAELLRLAGVIGAEPGTLHGLSGLGDIILTCSSRQSRNFSLGVEIGQGRTVSEVMAGRATVAEGAATAPVLADLAARHGVDMPVVDAVHDLVAGKMNARETITRLMARPLKMTE